MALIVGDNTGPQAEQALAVIRENPHGVDEACRRENDRLDSEARKRSTSWPPSKTAP